MNLKISAGDITVTRFGETTNLNVEQIYKSRLEAVKEMMRNIWESDQIENFRFERFFKEADGTGLKPREMQISNSLKYGENGRLQEQHGLFAVVAAFFGNDRVKPDENNTYVPADNSNMKLQVLMPDNKPHYMTYDRDSNTFEIEENPVPAPALAPKPSFWDRVKAFFGRNVESVNIYKASERKLKAYNDFCKMGADFKKAQEKQKAQEAKVQEKVEEPQKNVEKVEEKEIQNEQVKQKVKSKNNQKKTRTPEEKRMNIETPVQDPAVEEFRLYVQKTVEKNPKLLGSGDTALEAMKELKKNENNAFNGEIQKLSLRGTSQTFNQMTVVTVFNIIASDPERLANSDTGREIATKLTRSQHFKQAVGFIAKEGENPDDFKLNLDPKNIKAFVDGKGMSIKDSLKDIYADCGLEYKEKEPQLNVKQNELPKPEKTMNMNM